MVRNIDVVAIDPNNVFDRLQLCWGHLDNWRNLEIVRRGKKWLEDINAVFTQTTFIAYKDGLPAGMIEFIPQKLIKKFALCPCRIDASNNETEKRYILGKEFDDYLFISCLFVSQNNQGKGVGKILLNHFLANESVKNSGGALVYTRERDEQWDKFVHWPAGPKEFYLKAGFIIEKKLANPTGYLLSLKIM